MAVIILIVFNFFVSIISAINSTLNAIGRRGEKEIEKDLHSINFWGYQGYCLKNVYIPRDDGSTSEIDLLYITCKGFFVIESKNFSGYIFGSEQNKEWTSTLYAGKTWYGKNKVDKYQFYNPVWQNNTHITALKRYLGDITAISINVFGGNCELKNVNINKENVYICYEKKLKKLIKRIWDNTPSLYSNEEIKNYYNKLFSMC